MNHIAPILVLFGLAACVTNAHADIYAYVKPGAAVLLTDTVVHDQPVAWVIRLGATQPAVANLPLSKARERYQDEVRAVAHDYAVDLDLIHAVIATESNYMSNAVSPKGAIGLMQLMPSLAKEYNVVNAFDVTQNLRGGVQYLRHLLSVFDGNLELVLAAYNAGEGAVLRHGSKVPPFPETINYVKSVQRKYRERKQLPGAVPMDQ